MADAASAAEAWRLVVDLAIQETVDAVLLAGDIVDHANRFFEALGPLEAGLRRLAAAGIPTFAVAGNHDVGVLGGLADSLPEGTFHLLGRGGVWEAQELKRAGVPVAQLFGWSFPRETVADSPLSGFPADQRRRDLPGIAILHADLAGGESPYCPVSLPELRQVDLHAWVLGHIHKPMLPQDGERPLVLYPGSPQGLDPGVGERGPHGPVLLEIAEGEIAARQIPLAPLRFEELCVDVTGIGSETDLQQRLVGSLRQLVEAVLVEQPGARGLTVRLVVEGRCALGADPIGRVCEALTSGLGELGGLRLVTRLAAIRARPLIDLPALTRAHGLLGELARLIPTLAGPATDGETCAALLTRSEEQLSALRRSRIFLGLDDPCSGGDRLRQLLAEQAWRLMDALVQQGEGHDA